MKRPRTTPARMPRARKVIGQPQRLPSSGQVHQRRRTKYSPSTARGSPTRHGHLHFHSKLFLSRSIHIEPDAARLAIIVSTAANRTTVIGRPVSARAPDMRPMPCVCFASSEASGFLLDATPPSPGGGRATYLAVLVCVATSDSAERLASASRTRSCSDRYSW